MDPLDLDPNGQPKPAIDLMHPWSPFQELILKEYVIVDKEYVIVDKETQHRLPTLEAALASKYAAMISPHRDRDKREYDAADFRRLVRSNRDRIRNDDLRRLAVLIWERGGEEIDQFIRTALSDAAFPI
jgi:hypothetical protein